MMLRFVREFKAAFAANAHTLLRSNALPRLLDQLRQHSRTEVLSSLPHITLYGGDSLAIRCSMELLLAGLTGNPDCALRAMRRAEEAPFPHWHSQDLLLFDVCEMGADQRLATVAHLQQMSRHDCLNPNMRRHLVAVLNAHCMSATMASAMRRVVEEAASRCLFVFATTQLGQVDAALRSRTSCVRCAVDTSAVLDVLMPSSDVGGVDAALVSAAAEGSLSKLLLMLARHAVCGGGGKTAAGQGSGLQAFLEEAVTAFTQEIGRALQRQRAITAAEERRVHEVIARTVHTLETTGTRHADVFKALVHVLDKQLVALVPRSSHAEAMMELVHMMAGANTEACKANKHTFVLEAALLDIFYFLSSVMAGKFSAAFV